MGEILEEVRDGGDDAVLRLTARFDRAELEPGELRVPYAEIEGALGVLEPEVLDALRLAIANVKAVAKAQLREPVAVELPQGQRVEVAELPVRRAAAYVPGGRAPVPVHRGDDGRDRRVRGRGRAGGVRAAGARGPRAPRDPRRVRALRRDRGLPDGRGAGHRRAHVRYGVGGAGGGDRGPG